MERAKLSPTTKIYSQLRHWQRHRYGGHHAESLRTFLIFVQNYNSLHSKL